MDIMRIIHLLMNEDKHLIEKLLNQIKYQDEIKIDVPNQLNYLHQILSKNRNSIISLEKKIEFT
jgi:hypothetical protein